MSFPFESSSKNCNDTIPSGSRLAQYMQASKHGVNRLSKTTSGDASTSISYQMSKMNLVAQEEDRLNNFLNGSNRYTSPEDFYNTNHQQPTTDVYLNDGGIQSGEVFLHEQETCPAYYVYQGLPFHVWKNRLKSQPMSTLYINPTLKADLISRQLALQSTNSSADYQHVPNSVEQFHNITPISSNNLNNITDSTRNTSNECTYRAIKANDGLVYCLRRVSTPRPLMQKQLIAFDNWKRQSHPNLVQLREMFQTRAFGDNSFVFVYDFHPLAETLKSYYFGKNSTEHNIMLAKHTTGAQYGGLAEVQIWNYIIQLSAALRYIHSCGLAVRFLDISRILICPKSKILISSCGIADILQGDNNRNVVAQQVEDLRSLGMILIQLTIGRLNAITPENIATSLQQIEQYCSTDLKNTICILYYAKNMVGHKVTTISEIMPMIGARFYLQIENLQLKNDFVEDELSKEMENSRLFRILCKLNTVNERPALSQDPMWSETSERYLLKLFRDYVFHQFLENGKPWIDMSHILNCLNKLDAGVDENIQLISRDGENLLIVSYAELRKCLDNSFESLISPQFNSLNNVNTATKSKPEDSL